MERDRNELNFFSSSYTHMVHMMSCPIWKQRGTVDAVTKLINDVCKSYDFRQSTIAVFCYLYQAFDTIDHSKLLHKLAFYGSRGLIIMGKCAKPDLSDLQNDRLNNSIKSISWIKIMLKKLYAKI